MKPLNKQQMEIRPPWFVGQMFWLGKDLGYATKG
jgi:hypothetical protein